MGLDIAWPRPTVARIKSTGASWVGRYFSHDPSKNITAGEVVEYTAAALGVVTVWESTPGRATAGYAAGVADAVAAEQQRRGVALPSDHILYFAVDADLSWPAVQPYFDGVASVITLRRTGCYGGLAVVQGAGAHGIRYLWQTWAWSGGDWSPRSTIRQRGTALGGDADIDKAQAADFGQYPRPVPPPTPHPLTPGDDEMIMVSVDHTGYTAADWPGIFLLDGGKLAHVATPADEGAFAAAGIKGPVTITRQQYESILAGK
jgi:hypothetical protein